MLIVDQQSPPSKIVLAQSSNPFVNSGTPRDQGLKNSSPNRGGSSDLTRFVNQKFATLTSVKKLKHFKFKRIKIRSSSKDKLRKAANSSFRTSCMDETGRVSKVKLLD